MPPHECTGFSASPPLVADVAHLGAGAGFSLKRFNDIALDEGLPMPLLDPLVIEKLR